VQLIVAGFHRSGTSLLTQVLHSAGLFVGRRLLGAMPSNPYGHFEDLDFLELHRSILWAHGDDWQWPSPPPLYVSPARWREMRALVRSRDLTHRSWGFKDPRSAFFLGHWKYLMPDAKVVVVYRDPADSVRSMESRQASAYFAKEGKPATHLRFFNEPDHGLRLWNTYNRAIVSFVRAHREDCLVVPFADLVLGFPVVATLNERFGADLPEILLDDVFDASATTRREVPQNVFDPQLQVSLHKTWATLEDLASTTRTPSERRPR
jgi:hypothetical protein